MRLISWKSVGALLGTGVLCCFVSAIVIPHGEMKVFVPGPGGAPSVYTPSTTPPSPSSPMPSSAPPVTTSAPPDPPKPEPNRGYLSCAQMRGWDSVRVFEYWHSIGSPTALDNDYDGIPCETVLGERILTPQEWPTATEPPPYVPPAEAPPALVAPPIPSDRLPLADLPVMTPILPTDMPPSGHLVP